MNRGADLVVMGGGVIGCSVAYYAARKGLRVTLVDQPRRGRATSASAGGLWPLGESVGLGCGVIFYKMLSAGQPLPKETNGPALLPRPFLDFAMQSNRMFPWLTDELQELSGIDIEFERTSLLFLMYDEGDEAFAKPLLERCPCGQSLTERLSPKDLAKAEPAITRELRGAIRFQGDDQVNPYKLADAFREAARASGATILTHTPVTGLKIQSGRVTAVVTDADMVPCAFAVNAAGAWASEIGKLAGLEIPVDPIRGQIVCTETLPEILSACISTTDCYLVQKHHGEILIGSTTENAGYRVDVTPTALQSLCRGGVRALPFLQNVKVKRTWAGLRPGTPDELPILGTVEGLGGYLNACGHFRTGILNAPLTGLVIAEIASGAPPSFPIEPFLLSRFSAACEKRDNFQEETFTWNANRILGGKDGKD